MEPTWQDRFLSDPTHLRDDPGVVRRRPLTQADIRRNIAQLLGDTIETMDTMIAYSASIKPKVEAMREADIEWQELKKLNDCLQIMDCLRADLMDARPLHRMLAGVESPTIAFQTAMKHSDEICENAIALCGKVLDLHHALEATKQRMLLDTGELTGKQRSKLDKFTQKLLKVNMAPHTEATTLAAAVQLAKHDMSFMEKVGRSTKR